MPSTTSIDLHPSATSGSILVSDSDPAAREALVSVLVGAGFDCICSASATETLERVATGDFDLIIADIHLAGNSDLEMVRVLNDRDGSAPVILITDQPSIETAIQAVRLRVFEYLLKPVDGDKLVTHAHKGVALGRTTKMLRSHRRRMKKAMAKIDQCENLARRSAGNTLNTALSTYLNLAVQQSLSTITDVGDIAAAIISHDDSGEAQRRVQSARPLVLVDAVRETIQVLERSKSSFKSRELADLRRKLEELITSSHRDHRESV